MEVTTLRWPEAGINTPTFHYVEWNYDEAEPPCQEALRIRKQRLGNDDAVVASSLNDLATLSELNANNPKLSLSSANL